MREITQAIVLNKNFEAVSILDSFESFIWTDRYYEAGDFELVLAQSDVPSGLELGFYLQIVQSDHLMIIEDIQITKSSSEGSKVTLTGRSLESILDRRVIYEFSYLKGDFQAAIHDLLNNSIIKPTEPERKIPNFIFEENVSDKYISETIVDAQYFGISLYEVIVSLCQHYRIGFQVTLQNDTEFVFKLYHGANRSLSDTNDTGDFVIFSKDFGNIVKEEYLESIKDYKNAALIGGEGDGTNKVCAQTTLHDVSFLAPSIDVPTGLERREIYVDANDTSSTYKAEDGTESQMTSEQYESALKGVGQDELFNHSVTRSLNGEIETLRQFTYGTDFFLGDVVSIETIFAKSTNARIIEVTFSCSASGYEVYQTLQSINIGDYGEV